MSRISTTVLAVLALFSLQGHAQATDFHVGAAVGRSDFRIDTAGAASADTRDSAGKVFFGAAITPTFGVEAALFDLGQARGTVVVPGLGSVNASARVRGVGLAGVASLQAGPVSLFGKLGLARVRATAETSVSTGLPGSESAWQPTLGFGLAYPVGGSWVLRGEWERVRARFPGGAKDNVDLISAGVAYRF